MFNSFTFDRSCTGEGSHVTERVLIGGASGFIASHTIAHLLDAGFEIVGTVRDPDEPESTAHLKTLPGAAERLELVTADLMHESAFDAFTGEADYVIHMASPYRLPASDPERDLV